MQTSQADLVKLKLAELKGLCKEVGRCTLELLPYRSQQRRIKNYSKLNKAQLIQCLLTSGLTTHTESKRSNPAAAQKCLQDKAICAPVRPASSPISSNPSTHAINPETTTATRVIRETSGDRQHPTSEGSLNTEFSLAGDGPARSRSTHAKSASFRSHAPPTVAPLAAPSSSRPDPGLSQEDAGQSTTAARTEGLKASPLQQPKAGKSRSSSRERIQRPDKASRRPRNGVSQEPVKGPRKPHEQRQRIYLRPSIKVRHADTQILGQNSARMIEPYRPVKGLDECRSPSDRQEYLKKSFLPSGLVTADLGDGFAPAVRFVMSQMCINGTAARVEKAERYSRDIWKLLAGSQTVYVLEQTGESLGPSLRLDWEAFAAGGQDLHQLIRTKMDDEFPRGVAKGFRGDIMVARRCVLAACAGESFCGPKLRLHELDAESIGRSGAQAPMQTAADLTLTTAADAGNVTALHNANEERGPIPSWMKRVQLYLPEWVLVGWVESPS